LIDHIEVVKSQTEIKPLTKSLKELCRYLQVNMKTMVSREVEKRVAFMQFTTPRVVS